MSAESSTLGVKVTKYFMNSNFNLYKTYTQNLSYVYIHIKNTELMNTCTLFELLKRYWKGVGDLKEAHF